MQKKFAILKCTSIYPASNENLNLLSILTLKKNLMQSLDIRIIR